MAMNWTSLTSAKGVSGSIANWVSYAKLDINPVVDESQAILYTRLRTREMRSQFVFVVQQNNSEIALPARFLDPIGRMKGVDFNLDVAHKDENFVTRARNYSPSTGSFGANPFTTTNGASTVSCALTGHGFTQGGTIEILGASTVNGITLSPGSYPIISITDANDFVIDTVSQTASGSGSGGGSSATYTCNSLVTGPPQYWAIWDEKIKFDVAMNQDITFVLNYFQSLALLSASNLTNFLTNRYPFLMRKACQAMAADFMKDTEEFQKVDAQLAQWIDRVNIENDGFYRGVEIDPEIP